MEISPWTTSARPGPTSPKPVRACDSAGPGCRPLSCSRLTCCAAPTPFRKMVNASPTSSTSAPDSGMPSPTKISSLAASPHPPVPPSQIRRVAASLLLAPALLLAAPTSDAPTAPPLTFSFAVLADDPGPWPQILSSVGFQPQPADNAGILVLRPGAQILPQLTERIERGAFLILEGQSPAAESFGFHAGKERIAVGSLEDVHRPKLPIIWQKAIELPRFEVPKIARVFAKERWSAAPLIAGYA